MNKTNNKQKEMGLKQEMNNGLQKICLNKYYSFFFCVQYT